MYLIYAAIIRLTGPDVIYLRLWTTGMTLVNIFLIYLMVKLVLNDQKDGGKLGLLSAVIYAFYPPIMGVTSQLEAVLTFFALSSVIVYVKWFSSKNKAFLFLSGILLGCAVMTKLPGIYFIAAILLFHVANAVWHKEYKEAFVGTLVILSGVIVVATATLVWIVFYCDAFSQFYAQVFQWQLIRPSQMLWERQVNINWYASSFMPLIVAWVLAIPYCLKRVKEGNFLIILPILLYGINVMAFLTTSRFILFHYFIYLSPFLILLDVIYVSHIAHALKKQPKISHKLSSVYLWVSIIIVSATISQSLINSVPFVTARTGDLLIPFTDNPYAKVEYYVGNYVASITNSSDKIWTSEGGIAFFAQRMITPPNSSAWPFHVFFDDVFVVVSPSQFAEAWEKEQIRVIIFIKGKGWVPYPDGYIWYGTSEQQGVAGYVQEKYVLETFVTVAEVPYTYEIWVRK